MLTPIKFIKGQSEQERQFDKVCNDVYSRVVSKVRQPTESLFNRFGVLRIDEKD